MKMGKMERNDSQPRLPQCRWHFFRTCRWLTVGKSWGKWAWSKDMRRPLPACHAVVPCHHCPARNTFPLLFYNMNNFLRLPFESLPLSWKMHFKTFQFEKSSVSDSSLSPPLSVCVCCVANDNTLVLWPCVCAQHLRFLLIWFTFHFRLPYAASHTNSEPRRQRSVVLAAILHCPKNVRGAK